MRILRWNDVVRLPWEERFEPLLTLLDEIFQGPNMPHILHCAARALLLLSKEGQEPTTADILRRVCEEDAASPHGVRVGYDEDKWFSFILKAFDALQSDDPPKALVL